MKLKPINYEPVQAHYLAHHITLEGIDDEAFAKSLSSARVDMNPHQVEAAIFALKSPLSNGVLLADEVGLGKTIEAGLVIAQKWAERKRRILLVAPASLRKQWEQELSEKFSLPSTILEAKTYKQALKAGQKRPFQSANGIVILSYEFAARMADEIKIAGWDMVVFDEAHRMRNVYRKNGSVRAKALKDAVSDTFKVLLTATPLQNSLMELYGIVSVIDDMHFGGEAAFRSLYTDRTAAATMTLRERLAPICKRTLRRQVQEAGHINYTKRHAVLFDFEPASLEDKLYNEVSEFLQRKDTISYGDKANALVILQVRKVLGSSTFAVTKYLENLIERLKLKRPVDTSVSDDLDSFDELVEEADEEEVDVTQEEIDPVALETEILEIQGFLALAKSIGQNAKGEKLIAKLPEVFDEIEKRGGQRKAVIFTESVRTQTYLAKLLSDNGYDSQIVLLNGSNSDPVSKTIFEEWKQKHKESGAMSGSRSADMKAAVVDAFKSPEKKILIATESGAEGINLQFCSLLVNFDLPWNPQRVEQRIGRCHRYGQKIDVTVVNMLNRKNKAEERIYELLDQKFKLFDGVFGSSDEVLGMIESGVDFEKKVLGIVQASRNKDDIQRQFDELRDKMQVTIEADVAEARATVLEHLDQDVVSVLKTRKGELDSALDDYARRLLLVARAELETAYFHDENGPVFDYEDITYTTKWPVADEKGWQFFRLIEGNLAHEVVERAKARNFLEAIESLTFFPDQYPFDGQLVDVKEMKGKSGILRVTKARIDTRDSTREELLIACVTDDGEEVATVTSDRLLQVPSVKSGNVEISSDASFSLDKVLENRFGVFAKRIQTENMHWLDEEELRLDNYAKDIEIELDAQIANLEQEVKQLRKERRVPAISMEDKLALGRKIKRIEGDIDDIKLTKHERRRKVRKDVEDMLDEIAEMLNKAPEMTTMFTLRWAVQ